MALQNDKRQDKNKNRRGTNKPDKGCCERLPEKTKVLILVFDFLFQKCDGIVECDCVYLTAEGQASWKNYNAGFRVFNESTVQPLKPFSDVVTLDRYESHRPTHATRLDDSSSGHGVVQLVVGVRLIRTERTRQDFGFRGQLPRRYVVRFREQLEIDEVQGSFWRIEAQAPMLCC